MSTISLPARLPDNRPAWPLSLLFGIGNCVFILALTAAKDFLIRQNLVWLTTLYELLAELPGTTLLWLFLLAQPVVGMILQKRGKRLLGRALMFSLLWTIGVYAVGAAGVLGWLLLRN
jgi:hypothetical protein